jgi:hypothetical protein
VLELRAREERRAGGGTAAGGVGTGVRVGSGRGMEVASGVIAVGAGVAERVVAILGIALGVV